MVTAKLTSKYQTTVPAAIREFLDLKIGDRLGFEIENELVVLKKISPMDLEFARALEGTLAEWNSKQDTEAYRDL